MLLLGERIKELRMSRKYSQKELARILQVFSSGSLQHGIQFAPAFVTDAVKNFKGVSCVR
jgi:transcriptional regulator with XRE-family HTH domain